MEYHLLGPFLIDLWRVIDALRLENDYPCDALDGEAAHTDPKLVRTSNILHCVSRVRWHTLNNGWKVRARFRGCRAPQTNSLDTLSRIVVGDS